MKIVHALGWYFPDSLGGTEVYVAALSRGLRERGHQALVAAPDATRGDEARYEHDGIEVYRYPIPRLPTRSEAQSRTATRGTERFHQWLERTRPDVFHCHSIVTGLGLEELKAAKALGARAIVTCHTPSLGFICQRGTMMRWGTELCDGIAQSVKCASCALQGSGASDPVARNVALLPQSLSALGRIVPGRLGTALGMVDLIRHNAFLQRELLDSVDAFVVLTEWARRTAAANHGSEKKLVLNRLGIEPNGWNGESERTVGAHVRFGFVGRFHETKGIFVLAEALARLPHSLAFAIELRGPLNSAEDRAVHHRLQERLGWDPRVRFAPAVEHKEIARVLASYDVLLCPSIWLEGGPTIAMEAQAVGTPVVGSRIGGLAEIVDDGSNGRLVPPGDPNALAAAIIEVVKEPALIRQWRSRLRTPRTMDQVTRDYVALYEACLQNVIPDE